MKRLSPLLLFTPIAGGLACLIALAAPGPIAHVRFGLESGETAT
jgi:hypothetical protein